MYFIRELQQSECFNSILVVTHCVTKMQNDILAKITSMVEDITNSHIKEFWGVYGLSRRINSNHSSLFALQLLKS